MNMEMSATAGPSKIGEDKHLTEDEMKESLKVLTSMAKRPVVNLDFQDLTFTVNMARNQKKEILQSISGSFHTGKLTAILGPSGAGKSSLMNILVGYNNIGVTGKVLVNGKPRNDQIYHKLSCYIMQEDLMQEGITVEEAMKVAAELKLGVELKSREKQIVIEEILKTLGLVVCRKVRTENLSGGQRKRLAVALELVNNPPIIFLDEPTSGLDIVSMKHCINLLRHLAHSGRTIICTIHQPSASILSLFDNVYFLAKGQCVYQGSPDQLVPFLNKTGFPCPVTYNPADFIMESLQSSIENIQSLSKAIQNGKISEINHENLEIQNQSNEGELEEIIPPPVFSSMNFPTSFCTQFIILLQRMLLQKSRNLTPIYIQIIHHVLSGGLLGAIFYNIGNDGTSPIANFKFCVSILVFFMYTYVMIPVLLYPPEFKLLQREYFNRWYGLKAYYTALTVANIPVMVTFGVIFVALTYYLSGQLLEWDRFLFFSMTSILTAYCSEGFGLAIGSVFNVRDGSIMAPGLVSPLLALCFYGLGFGPYIETFMRVLMRLSYLRYGIEGLAVALYRDREPLECPGLPYCHYGDPKVLLRDLGMKDTKYVYEMLGLFIYTVFFRILTFLALRYRLQTEFSNKFLQYISTIFRYR